jgi:hypothetical protein
MKTEKNQVKVYLPGVVHQQLKELAEMHALSMSAVIEELVREEYEAASQEKPS